MQFMFQLRISPIGTRTFKMTGRVNQELFRKLPYVSLPGRLRERPLNKRGGGRAGCFWKNFPARYEAKKKKKKERSNPAIKKKTSGSIVWKLQLQKLSKKILAPHIPENNFSAPVCCEKKYSGPRKNPCPPCLFNGCSLKVRLITNAIRCYYSLVIAPRSKSAEHNYSDSRETKKNGVTHWEENLKEKNPMNPCRLRQHGNSFPGSVFIRNSNLWLTEKFTGDKLVRLEHNARGLLSLQNVLWCFSPSKASMGTNNTTSISSFMLKAAPSVDFFKRSLTLYLFKLAYG